MPLEKEGMVEWCRREHDTTALQRIVFNANPNKLHVTMMFYRVSVLGNGRTSGKKGFSLHDLMNVARDITEVRIFGRETTPVP